MSIDPRNWMWNEACAFIERAENLHRHFFQPQLSDAPAASWVPPIDIFEDEDNVIVMVALPGVSPDDLDIRMEDGTVVIRGRQHLPRLARHALIHRLEIPHGGFERRVHLPSGWGPGGKSEFRDGLLTLLFARQEV